MASRPSGKGKPHKVRVDFRPNRQKPARRKRWLVPQDQDGGVENLATGESVRARGELSRRRTITDLSGVEPAGTDRLARGTVIAVRGRFVEVEDRRRVWRCTVRRILRTRKIEARSPVAVGDQVLFAVVGDADGVLSEGVIEHVQPRRTVLARSEGRRTHVIAANADQILIIVSVREPMLKPHLIDRYIVAAHAGSLPAVVCVNKVDLDTDGEAAVVVDRYERLGYGAVATSVVTGVGLEQLRSLMTGRVTVVVGQSGVGKSSLLNALQPGLDLKTQVVSAATEKGRHTTTTAVWLKLDTGGAAIDTPGLRALDVGLVPLHELEMHFVEFVDHVTRCKFPDCVHIHEDDCAVKAAVEAGEIDESRYASYMELFYEGSEKR